MRSVQCAAFRNLFETLKDVLQDCNFIFEPDGVKCLQMDNNSNVIVSVRLNATSFEEYHCPERFVAGINVGNMFRLLKSIGQSDTLLLCVSRDNVNLMKMQIENFDKNMKSSFTLNLLDIDEVALEVPATTFDVIVTMPSLDLQRVCRDLSVLSEIIQVKSAGKKLILSASGDFATQSVELSENANGLYFAASKADRVDISASYSLKYLNLFSKANVLCATVDLYLKNDFPLILSYTIASLGKLHFCLAQKNVEDT